MVIDARGYACPHPVIMAKKAISQENPEELTLYVDNVTATENLSKMGEQLGFSSEVEEKNPEDFVVHLKKTTTKTREEGQGAYGVFFSSDEMGRGDSDFSKLLLENFIYSLRELEKLPKYIVCYNRGVFLTTENEKTIEDFKALEEKGVEILSCGLCLNQYGLEEKLKVGEITNMYRISEIMTAYSVVKP